jgi:hypothetical protein
MASSNDIPEGLSRAKSVGEMKSQEFSSFADIAKQLQNITKTLSKDQELDDDVKKIHERLSVVGKQWADEQKEIGVLIQSMKRSGASEAEMLAFIKKNAGVYMKSTLDVQKSIQDAHRDFTRLYEDSTALSAKDRIAIREQLALMERSVQFQENYTDIQQEIMDSLNKGIDDLVAETKAKKRQDELRDRLEESRRLEDKKFQKARDDADKKLQKQREKEDKRADKKGSLFTAMLGPLRLFTDPILKAVTKDGENTEEVIKSLLAKSLEKRREAEDEEIEARREKEDKERDYIKDFENRRNELYLSTQAQLDELAGGEAALLPVFEQRILEQESNQTEFQKYIQEVLPDKLGSVFRVALGPLREIIDPLNSILEISPQDVARDLTPSLEEMFRRELPPPGAEGDLTPAPEEMVRRKLPAPSVENILDPMPAETLRLELPPPGVESVLAPAPEEMIQRELPAPSVENILDQASAENLLREIPPPDVESIPAPAPEEMVRRELPAPSVENIFTPTYTEALRREIQLPSIKHALDSSPITSFIGEDKEAQEQLTTNLIDAEYNPLLEKTAPNRNTLLAKGGIIGASAVYLGNLLGDQLDDMTEGQDKKKGEGGLLDNVKGFLGKNGLALMKLAAPLAVMAVGGVMIKKGLDMQKRDTDDAKKHFEEGNTARGIETAWLGDRARLTEENATEELGRTTGKTALLAGGAATVGVGAAGAIAAGGALAGGAGLAGAGTAALAGMGAAFPPALIAAAVAVGVTVIAKGTQEAFELGWDKNQASIQKELNSVIFDEDATVWEKVKASAESTWKGFTGALAGGIREAGSVLDAETMIQNEKQIKFLQEQADAGNEDYARLLDLMQSEQFKAMDKNEQKMLMQSEGLYDDYEKMQQETQKSFGEHLLTAGRTVGGFFTGLADTTVEGIRGKETARWEAGILKGLETTSEEDIARLKQSQEYRDTMANGGDEKSAMEEAYLSEQKQAAIARGDLRKDGMAIQQGSPLLGGVVGSKLAKYFGLGDMGLAYKERKTGTDELDNEYRQTFEYSKRKAELMNEGKTTEEADLAVIAEQNQLYHDALTLRLKQSDDYKKAFDEELALSGDIKKAETEGLKAAYANKKNTLATTKLMKAKFTEVWNSVKNFAGSVGGWFKDKFSAAGQGMVDLGKAIAEGASAVWSSVTEWASGLWKSIGEKFTKVLDGLKDFGSGVLDAGKAGLDWLGDKAAGAWDWITGNGQKADASINDGIVLKNGKVIEISPDDNVYATKNEPRVIRDQEAQAAMPSIQKTPAEFTDKNIIAMLQAILDKLSKMDIKPQVVTSGGDINFDGLKMAGAL